MADPGFKIDDLVINISTDASKAVQGLKDLAKGLRDTASQCSGAAKELKAAADGAKKVGEASEKAADETEKLGESANKANKTFTTAGGLSESVRKYAKELQNAGNESQKATTKFDMFLASIKRIAMYRAIRSAIKMITTALKEGFEMFVEWDRESNGGLAGVANNMDLLNEKWTTLKGQIGALLGSLANGFIPIINGIIDGLTKLVDILQMVFRSLQGEYTYYKLIYQSAKATTGQAKELKRVLFGFDELNVLPSQSGSGLNTSSGKWTYEPVSIDSKFLNGIADISNKIKDFLGLTDDMQNAFGSLIGVVGTFVGAKVLGKLLGLLPSLISGFKNKNSALSDQTSKVTSDATATQGLATSLGLALGGATALSAFLSGNPFKVQQPEVDFTAFEKSLSAAKQYAANNPINIQLGATADLTGFAKIASFVATNPVTMAISLPISAVLTAAQSLRNTVQSWFNSNPWRIPVAVGKGAAQGTASAAAKIGGLAGGASAVPTKVTAADVEKQIRDSMLNYESDLWTQGGTLGKVVGTLGGATLASVTTGGFLTGSVLSGGVLAELLGLLGFAGSFASGGMIPNTGSLFYAGEAGAEVVANMGHSTGVMNVSQMQEAVASGNVEVVNAVYAMANVITNAINGKSFDIYMDTQKVGKSITQYQQNQARRLGYNGV